MIVEVHYQWKVGNGQFEIPDDAVITGAGVASNHASKETRYRIEYVVPVVSNNG